MLKLITSLTSPFGRKAWVAVLEKQIPCEIIFDVPWNDTVLVTENNPLGKVPILLRDKACSLFDSRVIVEYIDSLSSQVTPLIPIDLENRIAVKRVEALADGLTDALLNLFLEKTKRTPEMRSQWWIDRQMNKLNGALTLLSTELGENQYYIDNRYSLADISVVCSLGYVDLRFGEIDWRSTYPNLANFVSRLNERESFQISMPKP